MNKENDKRNYIQNRLYAYHFLNDGITFVLPTLMASLFIIFNLNWFQAGLIFAFNALALVLGQIIVGYYTDKHSELLMKFGLLVLALSSFLIIFSVDFISLLIFATMSGFALGFQHSISYSTTSRMFKDDRDVKIGRQGAAGDIGKCSAVFSSALLIILFLSWQLVLIIWSVGIFIVFLIIVYNFRKIEFRDYFVEIDEPNSNLLSNSQKSTNKTLVALIIISYILYAAAYTMIITNLATYLRVEKIGEVSEYSGLILGYTILFGFLGAYFSGIFKNKLGMSYSIIIIGLLLILILNLYVFLDSSDLILTLLFFGIIGFFLYIIYPQLLAATNNFTHPKKLGLGFGIVLSLGWFGNFLGALIGGYFANLYSPNMFFILGSVILMVLIILAIIMKLKYQMK
ncbi:MAG: MFS transporter [Promethearchaeota archaeon]|nr:MAG: MFS transporter [Candidatus Lokiarchaeota archaeon]